MKRVRSVTIFYAVLGAVLFAGVVFGQDDPEWRPPQKVDITFSEPDGNSLLAGIVVNSNGDGTDIAPGDAVCETAVGNGICTLRAAVAEANALAGNDVISFEPGITLIEVSGQIAITSNINIIGPGAGVLTIQNIAPLSTTSRVFNITNFVVNLSGLTISGGNVTGNGGGIQNTGTLTITNCVITNNRANGATGVGGGVRSTNNLTILNSVITGNASVGSTSGGLSFAGANLMIGNTSVSGNNSLGNGGGLNVSATVSVTITHSTISNNVAGAASGGMFMNRGSLINTTISGNTANGAAATDGGGGLRIQAGVNSVSITSCTITGNTAPNSASGARSGIWHETGTLTIASSIVAANIAQDVQRDGAAVLTSGGFNLIGENTSVAAEFPEGLPNGTNYVGTDAMPLDPMIGPLAANGGPTQTHALLKGSVAIDKGGSFSATDQRLFVRPIDLAGTPNAPGGDGSDIGSFEYQSIPAATVAIAGRVTDASGFPIPKARVFLTDGSGNAALALTSPFGYFRFDSVQAGATYVVRTERKGYRFVPVLVTPSAAVTDLNIMADP